MSKEKTIEELKKQAEKTGLSPMEWVLLQLLLEKEKQKKNG